MTDKNLPVRLHYDGDKVTDLDTGEEVTLLPVFEKRASESAPPPLHFGHVLRDKPLSAFALMGWLDEFARFDTSWLHTPLADEKHKAWDGLRNPRARFGPCPTENCPGDIRYAAPGRGHRTGCLYPKSLPPAPKPAEYVPDEQAPGLTFDAALITAAPLALSGWAQDTPQETQNGPSRPSWDEWALGLAEAVSRRADCTRRQVGAVILDSEHRVVATGYNGYPSGHPGCASAGACPRGRLGYDTVPGRADYTSGAGKCDALHAEENAILYARRDLRGATLYVNHKPCPNCERVIAGTGIHRAVWDDPEHGRGEMTFPG